MACPVSALTAGDGLPELFFSAASKDVDAEPTATAFFLDRQRPVQMDVKSGFLEDSTKDLWPSCQHEATSSFLPEPKKLHWQPAMRHGSAGTAAPQAAEASLETLPEPDSEPDVCPAPEPSLNLERLWQSTVEGLECRATWHSGEHKQGMPDARQAYLALYGISSELFQVDEVRWVVRYRSGADQLLRDWAISCSKCLRLKALAEKLVKNTSFTSQAFGAVLKDLLQSFYHDLSQRFGRWPRSFIQLHVATSSWLRRLQPVFVLCHVDEIQQQLEKMGKAPPLPKLPQGIGLLEHIFRSCRVHEISNCHFQASHRQLPAHLVPADMILHWIFQRAMQPFLDCLLTWTMDGCASIPKDFQGKKKIRFPGFLTSLESDMQDLAQKLSILGLQLPHSDPTPLVAPVELLTPGAFFEMQELQSKSFVPPETKVPEEVPSDSNCLALRFSVAEAHGAAAPGRAPAPVPAAPPATFFELPKPGTTGRTSDAQMERKEMQEETKRQQDELRMALDAQVIEKRALKEAAKKLDMEEEAQERALLGEPEDEMLLGEVRQQILEEHHQQQRRIAEESLLLRWKLERLQLAPKLRELYALEAEADARELRGEVPRRPVMEPEEVRRIPVEEFLEPSWGPVVNPFVEQRSPQEIQEAENEDSPDLRIHLGQDDPTDLEEPAAEHLKEPHDPHKQLVRQVLRQIYSACARAESESSVEVEQDSFPRPVLGMSEGYSSQISKDVMLVKHAGSRPMDVVLESSLLRPLRQQCEWVDLQVVRKVLDLQLWRRIEMLRRYMLMGESRLLEPFLTEAMATYAVAEVSDVRRAEAGLNLLFQSMVPRPTEPSDDNFLSSISLHLATVPLPVGHGPVRLLDGIRFSLKLDFPMNLFFSERVMLQYSRLFRMIALVNHTLECLKGSWWFLASTSSNSGEEMRSLAALRQGLHHFASTLHRYLLVGVVAAEFQKLEQKVRSARSLEEILTAQRACLGHCLAKAFLDTSQLEGAQDALAAVVGILDQALQLQCLLEEVAAQAPRSFPAWAFSRVHTIHGVFLDLRRSLQLCRPGDALEVDVFEEDFLEAWLLQWSRYCDQN